MELFPFFMDVAEKTCLIVGGGSVAKEKLQSLQRFPMRFRIVAERTDLHGDGERVTVLQRPFEDADINDADFVVCATDDRALNRRVSDLCKRRNIPVNVVDDAALCTFVMPSIVKRGDLLVAVSTSGKSPALAALLKRQIEQSLPERTEEILERMGKLRTQIPDVILSQEQRKRFYGAVLRRLLASDNALSEEEILEEAKRFAQKP